jgi:DNA-binding transcriptional ArsR family regulator
VLSRSPLAAFPLAGDKIVSFRLDNYSAPRLNIIIEPDREAKTRHDAYEAVFNALAHPARRRVLLAVYFNGGSMTAGDVAAMFAHAWQTTTRHLQVLVAAGLLHHQRQGRNHIYSINLDRLRLVTDWLEHFLRKP